MKFIHYGGDYREIDGHAFLFRNSVTVENRATIEKLLKDPAFRKVEDEKETQNTPQAEVLKDECPKCGRVVKRGKVMHQRHCKGPK